MDKAVEAVADELRTEQLIPFGMEFIPEWAQIPLRDIISADVSFQFVTSAQRRAELTAARDLGIRRLRAQNAVDINPAAIQALFY